MSIVLNTDLETKIRARAEAEGLSIEEFLQGNEELEALGLKGLESGAPIEVGPSYWQEKHRRLDERLKNSNAL